MTGGWSTRQRERLRLVESEIYSASISMDWSSAAPQAC